MSLTGWDFKFNHNESKGALCGSGLGIYGSFPNGWKRAEREGRHNFEVVDNFIAFNGREEGFNEGTKWSDGMTILQCDGGYIADNLLVDNTDIDLALGGGEECLVENNIIAHIHRYGFAGLNLGNFDGPRAGDHKGSVVRKNKIYSGLEYNTDGLLAIGLLVGTRPWEGGSPLKHIGDVYLNESNGNVMNAYVSDVQLVGSGPQGTFQNNTLGNVFGNNGFAECFATAIKYAIDPIFLDLSRLVLQEGTPDIPRINLRYGETNCSLR